MYELNTDNKFHRVYAIKTDALGIDPLLDRIVPSIVKIKAYKNHEVVQDERGAPDLIAMREYGSEDFWWHILTYNGICRFRDVVEGQTIRIPDLGAIISLTNDLAVDTPSSGVNITTI